MRQAKVPLFPEPAALGIAHVCNYCPTPLSLIPNTAPYQLQPIFYPRLNLEATHLLMTLLVRFSLGLLCLSLLLRYHLAPLTLFLPLFICFFETE